MKADSSAAILTDASQAEDLDLDRLRKDLAAASCVDIYLDLLAEIEAQLITPMAAYCESAARLHQSLIRPLEAAVEDDQSDVDPRKLWQQLRSYARPLRLQVLSPLGDQLGRLSIGQGVNRLSSQFLAEERLPRKRGWRWKRALESLELTAQSAVAREVYFLEQSASQLTSSLIAALERTDAAVYQLPDDPDWAAEDVRYSTIRWITSHRRSFGAIGPSRVDLQARRGVGRQLRPGHGQGPH